MKAAHLRKIAARVGRLKPTLGNPVNAKRALRGVWSHYEGLTLANRVRDMTSLVNDDVPGMIAWITDAKQEKIRLLAIIRDLNEQLEATITEPDVEIENKEPGVGDVLKAMGYLD